VPPNTYGELRDSSGSVLSHLQLSSSTASPKLPATLTKGHLLSTGSVTGTGRWRVYSTAAASAPGPAAADLVVIAVPMTEVTKSLHRLVLIEAAGAAALLALLALGSWLALRRELHPLEEMATAARSITGGDLSERVPSGGPSEVGQLGLALNTMLDGIEVAFAERDATEKRLRQFLSDASHELRTPLTSIQGFAELFRMGGDGRDHVDQATIMRRIEDESARMKLLVEDLLLLARLDETRPVDRAPVDLAVLAADACSDAVAAAPDRPVTLDAPAPVVVLGDEAHLRQAIANLVSNAVRHTPAGTPIDVSAQQRGGEAVVTVRDHGPGLDDDAIAHVFDRFWQANRARSGTGTGLGLSIVAAVAGEHGGRARAANASDGSGGAVFTLTLPVSAPASTPISAPTSAPVAATAPDPVSAPGRQPG
jgi:two-component system OmpR family sensor kinase